MTLRIVPTPLQTAFPPPEQRTCGFDPALLPAVLSPPGHAELKARLSQDGVLVVTTGQQPALFTGPLFTIYKALSAAALATVLERQWSRPVLPLFWVAGDDHDFAEASHAEWLAADGSVTGARLPPRAPDAPLTPMYREPLGPAVSEALAALERDLPPSEFREPTLDWIRRHFLSRCHGGIELCRGAGRAVGAPRRSGARQHPSGRQASRGSAHAASTA